MRNMRYTNLQILFLAPCIELKDFIEFKKQIIAMPGYSYRKVIKENVLFNFHSNFVINSSRMHLSFFCDDVVKALFNKYSIKSNNIQ